VVVSVIIPLLNEEENIKPLYERLKGSLSHLPCESEIVFVDDGSTDSTLQGLKDITANDTDVKVIPLKQNMGQHAAILEGFRQSEGEIVVTLDGDLQNPPEEIPRLVGKLSEGFDVVAGWRKNRMDSPLRLLLSHFLNLFASLATGVRMRDYGCMMRAYRRDVLESVSACGRHTPFIPTLVTSMGSRTCEVPIRHAPRTRGISKYGLRGLVLLYSSLVTDFIHIKMGFRPGGKKSSPGKIAFFGYGLVGHACLKFLLTTTHKVVCVVTHVDEPDEELWFPSVCDLAAENGIPVLLPPKVTDPVVTKTVDRLEPDLILSAFYRQILPQRLLDIPQLGAVNLHPSLLPRYRGRCPLNWAVINGENRSGVTLHYMTLKADTGNIIDRLEFAIADDDDIRTVYEKTVTASLQILEKSLPTILKKKTTGTPQDETEASYFGRRTPEDGRINWTKDADEIHNLIRGVTHPFPGAFSFIKDKKLFIWKADVTDRGGVPGAIIGTVNGSFLVGAGRGALVLKRTQIEGEAEIDGTAALHRLGLKQGDRFDF